MMKITDKKIVVPKKEQQDLIEGKIRHDQIRKRIKEND